VRGETVYHEIGAAEQYASIYDPMLYAVNGVFLKLFGPSIFSASSPTTAALLAAAA
jgi:hypothetical protein